MSTAFDPKILEQYFPRVMTLDEVLALGKDEYNICWLEGGDEWSYRNGMHEINDYVRFDWLDGSDKAGFQMFDADLDTYLRINKYGITWRCWTTRPTKEMMEATKWSSLKLK